MEKELKEFKQLLAEITDLGRANALLGWDQQVYMPGGGAEDRGNILETLATIQHNKFVSKEMGDLVGKLLPYADTLDPESDG
jgi:carboxypeptidase Taq